MKIIVLCNFPFPDGLAATVRIRAYLKGLSELGCKTKVFVYNPSLSYNSKETILAEGETIEGIPYFYPNNIRFNRNRILRFLEIHIINWIRTAVAIYKENKSSHIDYLFIANDKLTVLFWYTSIAKLLKIQPVFITDEYPAEIRRELKDAIPRYKKVLYKFIIKKIGYAIFMTKALERYYTIDINIKSYILPTITDYSRFNIEKRTVKNPEKYICYMGNMELSKDNVDNIIIAFSYIADKFKDVKLLLYGAPSEYDRNVLEQIIKEKQLTNQVILKGRVGYSEVPEILQGALILVSSQPDSKRAEGGFPTKLGEYLAAGRPALFTDVGEISKYVEAGKHVYIVPPGRPDLYAAALEYILKNYDEAQSVALEGKQYLSDNFDYKIISQKLYDFLKNG